MRFFPLLCLLLLCVACDKNETDPVNNERIYGEWSAETLSATGQSTTTYQGQSYDADFSSRIVEPTDFVVEFTRSGQYSSSGVMTQELSGEANGQSFAETMTFDDFLDQGAYEVLNGELVVVSDSDQRQSYTIVSLSDTELVLDFEYQSEEERDGATFRMQQVGTLTLLRVN